jgi:Protein of unknown function (DUF3108)
MKLWFPKLSVLFPAALAVLAAPVGTATLPSETLRYSINWPSGLSLGEAQLSASNSKPSPDQPAQLHLAFELDASIPGFSASDRYRSEATAGFCSAEFQRTAIHGQKKTNEKISFDAHAGTATRETDGGGKSELKTSSCGRDALTFLYFVRQELSQGRFPPPQTVLFGAPYEVRLDFAGTQSIRIADTDREADRFKASVTGPASSINFEVFFLKDQARTPALVRVPFAMGTFSMELVK